MKTQKLVNKILGFFDLKKKEQKKEIDKLNKLSKSLKEKRKYVAKNLKNCTKKEKDNCVAELKAIDNLNKKTKITLKKLK